MMWAMCPRNSSSPKIIGCCQCWQQIIILLNYPFQNSRSEANPCVVREFGISGICKIPFCWHAYLNAKIPANSRNRNGDDVYRIFRSISRTLNQEICSKFSTCNLYSGCEKRKLLRVSFFAYFYVGLIPT